MGTLTSGLPRLSHYCEHKLPTSCRLTSIGECCACYDNRAHSASYSTYIDGVGFVQRGTRWQRYCWFCKEFWENRVQASGLTPGQTRIPERPVLNEFLERWYEFHQGYRLVRRGDGSEERVAVLGEDFKDVAPGCLPRTLDELRVGRERSEAEERDRLETERQRIDAVDASETRGLSLQDALDQLLQDASAEEANGRQASTQTTLQDLEVTEDNDDPSRSNNIHAQAMTSTGGRSREYQARRVAALRRELHRMRNGIERVISGLRDLGEDVPDHSEASARLSALGTTLDAISAAPSAQDAQQAINSVNELADSVAPTQNDRSLAGIQSRVNEARQRVDEARQHRDQAATELDLAEQEFRTSQSRLRQLQSEQRTTENYVRLFGTREEMIAQGDTYESPIGGMFNRAMERFQAAEQVRREERTLRRVLADESRPGGEAVTARLADLQARERDVWGVPRAIGLPELEQTSSPRLVPSTSESTPASAQLPFRPSDDGIHRGGVDIGFQQYYSFLRGQNWSQQTPDASEVSRGQGTESLSPLISTNSTQMYSDTATGRSTDSREFIESPPEISTESGTILGVVGEQQHQLTSASSDFTLDAVFVLSAIRERPEELQQSMEPGQLDRLLRHVTNGTLDSTDQYTTESFLADVNLVWGVRLPEERNRRRRQRGEHVTFTPDAWEMAAAGQPIVHDVEVMAECFQMSAQVRRQSGLSAPQQLAMLYRLQRGERSTSDRLVLEHMLLADNTVNIARSIHEQQAGELSEQQSVRQAALESERRQAARQGDHSRSELDAQRRAASSVALAAGRLAMAAGPSALLQRAHEAENYAEFQRLVEHNYIPSEVITGRRLYEPFSRDLNLDDFIASPVTSDSEDESEEGRGLDAENTGRPTEPMTEEEMTVLLDCRICYSFKAEVVTAPCGHLAMCRWCSDQHSPCLPHDRTRPRRAAACPVCRKQIRQKILVHRS